MKLRKNSVRLLDKSSGMTLFEAELELMQKMSRTLLSFKKLNWTKSLKKRYRPRLIFPLGVVLYIDFKRPTGEWIRNSIWRVLPSNPFFFKEWFTYKVQRKNAGLILEEFPKENRADLIEWSDHEIQDQKRIHFLIENMLVFIEERETSKLYKDAKTGLYWQWVKNPAGVEFLEQVALPAWEYEYLERKHGLINKLGGLSDDEFFQSLDEDPAHGHCVQEGCESIRARMSSLCKIHHFEAVRGHKYVKITPGFD